MPLGSDWFQDKTPKVDAPSWGRISKRGNKHLPTLFIQAAYGVLAKKQAAAQRALWPGVERAAQRLAHRNPLATALANKLARIAWAVLTRGHDYWPEVTADVA